MGPPAFGCEQDVPEVRAVFEKFMAANFPPLSDMPAEEYEKRMKEVIPKMIADVDANGDGVIEWSELVAVFIKCTGEPDEATVKAKTDAEIPVDKVPEALTELHAAFGEGLKGG